MPFAPPPPTPVTAYLVTLNTGEERVLEVYGYARIDGCYHFDGPDGSTKIAADEVASIRRL